MLALKGNYSRLAYVAHHHARGFCDIETRRHVTEEQGQEHVERRECMQFTMPADLPDRSQWKGVQTLGVSTLVYRRGEKVTTETRYFLSSLPLGKKLFARSVRSHWLIENNCHSSSFGCRASSSPMFRLPARRHRATSLEI